MKIKGGWHGKILYIDLTRRVWDIKIPDPALFYSCIGGKGLATELFSRSPLGEWDSPYTPLIISTGPLADTPVCSTNFATVFSRSPLTGTIGDFSFPGSLGNALKKCGYDAVVLTGKASSSVGISIDENGVHFSETSHLRGLSVDDCVRHISPFPQLFIGAAADCAIPYANVIIDRHWARGRNGLGLCFSKKNIKYVRFSGSSPTHIHDEKLFADTKECIRRLIFASPSLMGEFGIGRYGTGALFDLLETRRMMPTDLFRKTVFENAAAINACRFHEHFSPRAAGCQLCPVQCMRLTKDGDALAGLDGMLSFGPQILNSDIEAVQKAVTVCNNYGLDPISTSLLFAESCHKADSKTAEQVHVRIKNWVCGKESLPVSGNDGSAIGSHPQASAFTIKGQHIPPLDPRGAYGMALSMAVSTRGADDSAFAFSHEILRKPVVTDRFSFSGKARITALMEDTQAAWASLAVCRYYTVAVSLDEYAKLLTAVSGISFSSDDLLAAGRRTVYRERMINARYGFGKSDDTLPEYFFTHRGTGGNGIEVKPLPRSEFESALQAYYTVRGLTKEGQPTRQHASALGLLCKE